MTTSLSALEAVIFQRSARPAGGEVRFLCPAHDDHDPSARWNPNKQVWCCDVCGAGGGYRDLADRLGVTLTDRRNGAGRREAPTTPVRLEHSNTSGPGVTLKQYAEAKRLDVDELRSWGITEFHLGGRPALRIPYLAADGTESAVQFRLALEKSDAGDGRFKWKSGAKSCLYGLDRLQAARDAGYCTLVEGASDCHALWHHGEPALGLPGAGNWRDDRDAVHLDGLQTIYVNVEPDKGGESVKQWLGSSGVRSRVGLVSLREFKDPGELHSADPSRFLERWQAALAESVTWVEYERAEQQVAASAAYRSAEDLLRDPRLLDRVGHAMAARGYAGDLRQPKLGYVAMTSRLLERPGNLAYVAQSAAGKNRAVDAAAELMPPEAIYVVKAGSARALVYADEDFKYRVVIVGEADSIPEDGPAASAVRSLAADNYMGYDVVEKDPDTGQWRTRHIIKEGPTGLITTSTRSLGDQMGTRVLEVSVPDDKEQTRAVLREHARKVMCRARPAPDLERFLDLQRWLATGGARNVAVPFADILAELMPVQAVRMRRDFVQLLTSVQAIALLYQKQRSVTTDGWVEATIEDYARARELLEPVFDTIATEGATPALRQTVEAVLPGEEINETQLATRLGLSKSTVSWRVKRAIEGGWLLNGETRKGCPAKLTHGSALPERQTAMPDPVRVREAFECSNANRDGGVTPLPLSTGKSPSVPAAGEGGEGGFDEISDWETHEQEDSLRF